MTTPDQNRQTMIAAGAAVTLGLAALAVFNTARARKAEAAHPPQGRFVETDDVRLHYMERGQGPVIVLIHGNGSMIADFITIGLVDLLAKDHRVVVFDRPGYGHSSRPRGQVWSAQARAIGQALDVLGIDAAVVLGHSWGASVATALALPDPQRVRGLVLVSGFYFPAGQIGLVAKSLLLSGPAQPLIGQILRRTIVPAVGRLLWPRVLQRLFAPAPVPARFDGFPREMALRPSQIAAAAGEAGLLVALRQDYGAITMLTAIVAGTQDQLIDSAAQSWRLHDHIPHSTCFPVSGTGHRVHQTAPGAVAKAVRTIVADAFPDPA